MIKQSTFLAALLAALPVATAAEAKLFKWVDKDGVTHYGEVIPPEYADRDTQTLSSKGRLEQRDERLDKNKANTGPALSKEEQEKQVEEKRRDNALLNSYSNEKEIDLAMNRSLQLLDARVSSFSTMVKSQQETVDDLHKEMTQRTQGGKKAPQSLLDDVSNNEARLERLKKDLANSQQEVANVKARFAADKARYRELKGLSSAETEKK